MGDLARRKALTFEQAEGAVELPRQLARTELSPSLRAMLWNYVHDAVSTYDGRISDPWKRALLHFHVRHQHLMVDDFDSSWWGRGGQAQKLRGILEKGDYLQVYGFLQFMLREDIYKFSQAIEVILRRERAGYRVVDGNTLVPIASDEEAVAVEAAFRDLKSAGFSGAKSHLTMAAAAASNGDWSGCIRESVNAVESVAKTLAPTTTTLGPALVALEQGQAIHPALKRGFSAIYGFTSDAKGLRHPLIETPAADVDEVDALFMLSACASFVSYLINKGRAAGLLEE